MNCSEVSREPNSTIMTADNYAIGMLPGTRSVCYESVSPEGGPGDSQMKKRRNRHFPEQIVKQLWIVFLVKFGAAVRLVARENRTLTRAG